MTDSVKETGEHGNSIYNRCESCNKVSETQRKVSEAFETISRAINGGWGDAKGMLSNEVANEHPTLAGQLAKAVAIGIVRRAVRDPKWKPFDGFDQLCHIPRNSNYNAFSMESWVHPDHDGRIDCSTVVGAILMARQSYI